MPQNPHCYRAAALSLSEGDCLRPDWPAPAKVHALCSTRTGGVSRAAFASMNLGDHVGDAPEAVQTNRQRLQATLAQVTPGARPVFLQQVHGTQVVELVPDLADGVCADAALTAHTGLACTVMVADCLPVLITDRAGRAVRAPAPRRGGLRGGVVGAVLARFCPLALMDKASDAIGSRAPLDPAEVLVWLGPCIGPQAFEVGAEVRAAFCATDPQAAACFVPQAGNRFLADLPGLARQRLAALGVQSVFGNDGSDAWCTVAQSSRFFSHRLAGGRAGGTGRMAACIWIG
jgi:YfiH family protein